MHDAAPITPPPPGPRTALAAATQSFLTVAGYSLRVGILELALSTVCVQGLSVVAQLIIAHLLGPTSFGVVRTVEVVVSIALILATLGMPTLAIKEIAETRGRSRAVLLGRLLQVSCSSGLLVAAVVAILAPWLVAPSASSYLRILIWVLPFSAVGRTALNFFQGIQAFKRMAWLALLFAGISLPVVYVAVLQWKLSGWMLGRFLGEGLLLVGALATIGRRRVAFRGPLPARYSFFRIAGRGFGISLSLLVRTGFDGLAILMIGWCLQDSRAVGQYGLAQLLVTGALVLPGTLANVYLPKLASQSERGGERFATFGEVVKTVLAAMAVLAILLALSAPLLPRVFGAAYHATVPILIILSLLLPCRALASATGTYLLTIDEVPWMVKANVAELALACGLYLLAIPRAGIAGAAWATVAMEIVLTAAYLQRAHGCHRRIADAPGAEA